MNKYVTLGKTFLIVLFSFGVSICLLKGFYFTTIVAGLLLLGTVFSLYYDQWKIVRKIEYMISSIHYGDLNIALPDGKKGVEGRLTYAMNEALEAFRTRLYYSVVAETEVEAWQKLIRVLTHEIMNSMAPIISLSETVTERAAINGMNEKDYEIMLQAISAIHRRGKGLLEFVENYRQLTRIPMPKLSYFSVTSFFRGIKELLPADADITFEVRPQNMYLRADRSLLEQVVINVVKNGVEATKADEKPTLHLFAGQQKGRPVIIVTDHGTGIVPEAIDKIFVPFYTTKTGGSGIGLSICRQIMNRHGGTITIQSEPDKETSVSLVFPPVRY